MTPEMADRAMILPRGTHSVVVRTVRDPKPPAKRDAIAVSTTR